MARKKILLGMLAAALTFGFTAVSCTTSAGAVQKTGWSEYTIIPSKDYTVVDVIVIRASNPKTLNADLMDEAKKIGAHDIINVRVDIEVDSQGQQKIVAASAVAIKYTDTLKSGDTVTSEDGKVITSTQRPVMGASGGGDSSSTATPARKKFLGIF